MNNTALISAIPYGHHPNDDALRGLPLALAVSATLWCLLFAGVALSLHIG